MRRVTQPRSRPTARCASRTLPYMYFLRLGDFLVAALARGAGAAHRRLLSRCAPDPRGPGRAAASPTRIARSRPSCARARRSRRARHAGRPRSQRRGPGRRVRHR
jgi:hypothetical protein